MVAPFSL